MSDLTEMLRNIAKSKTRREEGEDWHDSIEWKAADTIDRLTRELAEARDKASAVVGFPATMTTEAHDGRGTVIIRFDTLKDAYGFVDALVACRAMKEKP